MNVSDYVFLNIPKRQWDELAAERDALRAENEALRRSAQTLDELTPKLRAELTETEQALEAAEAENEGLKSAYEVMRNVADERKAEIERLRAALAECFPLVRPGTDLSRRLRELLDRPKAG